jgi:hypothetical protein
MENNSIYNVLTAPNIICKCGSKLFQQRYILKHVSSIVSPSGKDEIIEIPVFVCSDCGEVPEEYKTKANYKYIFGEESIINN